MRYEIAVLNAAYSLAVEEDEVLAVRPMFKLPSVENRRVGCFEPGAFAALLLELPEYLRPLIRFLYLTGWRRSEGLRLRWDAVDWEGQEVRLGASETKSGTPRSFPFGQAQELKELLEAQWKARDFAVVLREIFAGLACRRRRLWRCVGGKPAPCSTATTSSMPLTVRLR